MKKAIFIGGLVGLWILGLGIVGAIDYEDQQLMQKIYKEGVCNGEHPDYKRIGVECE